MFNVRMSTEMLSECQKFLKTKILLSTVKLSLEMSAAIGTNVLRLMAVGLLEHSTFLTDKRLFKDTNVY